MQFNYASVDYLRQNHPAWRLLTSDHAVLITSFLNRLFLDGNVRAISEANLTEALEDELYTLREMSGNEAFPRPAGDYLTEWADPQKCWLRKFYPQNSDEPHFDLTSASENAIVFLQSLQTRPFVGTESRLLTLVDLLKQMTFGSETDQAVRVEQLRRERDALDEKIALVERGEFDLLDDTALKERFLQFTKMARDLLSDFREVEQNFRMLDRQARERIAVAEGGKGALLHEVMGEREEIVSSDQGRSFHAFGTFLLSSERQGELALLLERVMSHPTVRSLNPDARLRYVHHDWLQAQDHAQRTVAQLSAQLRHFVETQSWLENRRIAAILRSIEGHTLKVRENLPQGDFTQIDSCSAALELPMERPLFSAHHVPMQAQVVRPAEPSESLDDTSLFTQKIIDTALLTEQIRKVLRTQPTVTLLELSERYPLRYGLAELVAYLQLAIDLFGGVVDAQIVDTLYWTLPGSEAGAIRQRGHLSRVIFFREVL